MNLPSTPDDRRHSARRTSLWLALVALGFYAAFILVTAQSR